MNYKQIIALVVLALGVCSILYSIQMLDSFREFVSLKITGKYSEGTLSYLIGGILLVILGASSAVIFRTTNKK